MVELTMTEKLPKVMEMVDYHAALDVVTALQKHKELNWVADALPKHLPATIKKFATYCIFSSRAILGVALTRNANSCISS